MIGSIDQDRIGNADDQSVSHFRTDLNVFIPDISPIIDLAMHPVAEMEALFQVSPEVFQGKSTAENGLHLVVFEGT